MLVPVSATVILFSTYGLFILVGMFETWCPGGTTYLHEHFNPIEGTSRFVNICEYEGVPYANLRSLLVLGITVIIAVLTVAFLAPTKKILAAWFTCGLLSVAPFLSIPILFPTEDMFLKVGTSVSCLLFGIITCVLISDKIQSSKNYSERDPDLSALDTLALEGTNH